MKFTFTILLTLLSITWIKSQSTGSNLIDELISQKKYKQAVQAIDQQIKKDPLQARYYVSKADCYWQMEEYQTSFKVIQEAIMIMPDSVMPYRMAGSYMYRLHMFTESIFAYNKALEKTKDTSLIVEILIDRGASKSNIMDFEGAYEDYQIAFRLDPGNINLLNNLATVCDEVNRPNETISYLEKIISIDSTYVPAYVNLGFKNHLMGEYAQAIKYFDKALQLSPNEPLAYNNRGFSKYKLNDLEGALKDINYSLKLMPSNSYAYKNRALVWIMKGKTKAACEDLNKAKSLGFADQYGEEVDQLLEKHCAH